MSLPCASNCLARPKTSKAVSVPSRDIRFANRKENLLFRNEEIANRQTVDSRGKEDAQRFLRRYYQRLAGRIERRIDQYRPSRKLADLRQQIVELPVCRPRHYVNSRPVSG